jgi:hypothetical protein
VSLLERARKIALRDGVLQDEAAPSMSSSSSSGPEALNSDGTAKPELVPREVLCVCGVTVLRHHGVRDGRRAALERSSS